MQTTFIYTLTCPISGEIRYVGKSNNIKNRVNQHIYRVKKTSIKLEKDLWVEELTSKNLKPIIEVIDEIPLAEWDYWERFWILIIMSWGFNLTNIKKGGNGYGKHTPETIEKISKSLSGEKNPMYGKNSVKGFLGKKHSKEVKEKISKKKIGENNHFYGEKHSEGSKNKMSDKSKLRVGDKNSFYNKKHSEETKKKISETLKNKYKFIDNNNT